MKKTIYFSLLCFVALLSCKMDTPSQKFISADNENYHYMGRFFKTAEGNYLFAFPGASIQTRFTGTSIALVVKDYPLEGKDSKGGDICNWLEVVIDDTILKVQLNKNDTVYPIGLALNSGVHRLNISKRTEGFVGHCDFKGIMIDNNATIQKAEVSDRKLLFVGNSITCGYGNEEREPFHPFSCATENAYMSYASVAARQVNSQYHLIAYSGIGMAQNSDGTNHQTMKEVFHRYFPDSPDFKWKHHKYQPHAICINLGTNDFFSGVDTEVFEADYLLFVNQLIELYPQSKIVMLLGPMLNNQNPEYALEHCRNLLQAIKTKLKSDKIYFFELSGQSGKLGYGANMHPSVMQHEKNAEELSAFLQNILNW